MRILFAVTVFAIACGGTQAKKESPLVNEGADQSPTCCCKTLPSTAEKEIVPIYELKGRMECSGIKGDCVDEVQCAGQEAPSSSSDGVGADGVPPPPTLEPSNP